MYRANNGFFRNTLTELKRATFVILKSHASALIKKERLSSTSKARREASRNEFVEKEGVPDRVESFGEIVRSKNRPIGLDLLNPYEMD